MSRLILGEVAVHKEFLPGHRRRPHGLPRERRHPPLYGRRTGAGLRRPRPHGTERHRPDRSAVDGRSRRPTAAQRLLRRQRGSVTRLGVPSPTGPLRVGALRAPRRNSDTRDRRRRRRVRQRSDSPHTTGAPLRRHRARRASRRSPR